MDFFNENEIKQLSEIAGKTYHISNTKHQIITDALKNGLWDKTYFWADEICKKLDGFSFICKKVWSQRGWEDGQRVSTFKPYTWAKIFKTGDESKDIYFTVGADGETEALVYKLDYQFSGNKYLTDSQKEICERLIKASKASWMQIDAADLTNYSWKKLIKETINFIKAYESFYNQVMESVWPTVERRVSRLAWNANGWVLPSGRYGKSTSEDSHEAKYGYGHEEWLFDTSKIIDGYHYGFLEPIRKEQDTYANKTYNVWLYTINGVTKKRYWIGILKNVEVINGVLANNIKEIYTKKGWLQEMEEQIIASGANHSGFSDWKGIDLFNIRYKIENLDVNDPYYELSNNHPIYDQSRYVFMFYKDNFGVGSEKDQAFIFIPPQDENQSTDNNEPDRKTYIREAKAVEIEYLHRDIQKKLIKILKNKYGSKNVTPEHKVLGTKKVDIVAKVNDSSLIFYEIKAYNAVTINIREAIGQLFEYSYWPDKHNAKELIIITQKPPDFEEAVQYIQHIRKMFNIPLYYQWFDIQTNSLSEKY
jgi:hypothetical protein